MKKSAFPTASGNGFKAFELYTFEHVQNGLYSVVLPNGAERVDTLDGKKSAHLWDGKNWGNAGRFIVVNNDHSYREIVATIAAYRFLSLGYRVWLAKSKKYGFFENKQGLAVSFQSDFGSVSISGNYRAIKHEHGCTVGTGWRCNDTNVLLTEINETTGNFTGAPSWATKNFPVKLSTAADHLAHYPSSDFFEVL